MPDDGPRIGQRLGMSKDAAVSRFRRLRGWLTMDGGEANDG